MACAALCPPAAVLRAPCTQPPARRCVAPAAPSRRPARLRSRSLVVALLPIPNPFARLVIPNPNPTPAVARTLLELLQTHPKWELRKTADHGETAVPRLRLHLACATKEKGHRVLEALQKELYQDGEKGCRVRRESQAKFSLCCEGVEVLLNEAHHDVTIDVPIDTNTMEADAEAVKRADVTLKLVEKTIHAALHEHPGK